MPGFEPWSLSVWSNYSANSATASGYNLSNNSLIWMTLSSYVSETLTSSGQIFLIGKIKFCKLLRTDENNEERDLTHSNSYIFQNCFYPRTRLKARSDKASKTH